MELDVTLGVLGPILVEKPPPKVARARCRAETRDSFLEASSQQRSGRSWSYLEMPMNSYYVGRQFCTRICSRTYAVARASEEGKNPISLLRGRVETCHEIEPRPSLGVLAHILDVQQLPKVARVR